MKHGQNLDKIKSWSNSMHGQFWNNLLLLLLWMHVLFLLFIKCEHSCWCSFMSWRCLYNIISVSLKERCIYAILSSIIPLNAVPHEAEQIFVRSSSPHKSEPLRSVRSRSSFIGLSDPSRSKVSGGVRAAVSGARRRTKSWICFPSGLCILKHERGASRPGTKASSCSGCDGPILSWPRLRSRSPGPHSCCSPDLLSDSSALCSSCGSPPRRIIRGSVPITSTWTCGWMRRAPVRGNARPTRWTHLYLIAALTAESTKLHCLWLL